MQSKEPPGLKATFIILILIVFATELFAQAQITYISVDGATSVYQDSLGLQTKGLIGMILLPGDSVFTESNTYATILYSSGKYVQLPPNSSYSILSREQSQWYYALKTLFRRTRPKAKRGARAFNDPLILYPRKGKILANIPDIKWLPVQGSSTYKVQIEQIDSECLLAEELVWAESVNSTFVTFPDTVKSLREGLKFRIQIDAVDGGQDISACFETITEQKYQSMLSELASLRNTFPTVESDDITGVIVEIGFLMSKSFFSDAFQLIAATRKTHPHNPILKMLAQEYFYRTGLPDLTDRIEW